MKDVNFSHAILKPAKNVHLQYERLERITFCVTFSSDDDVM